MSHRYASVLTPQRVTAVAGLIGVAGLVAVGVKLIGASAGERPTASGGTDGTDLFKDSLLKFRNNLLEDDLYADDGYDCAFCGETYERSRPGSVTSLRGAVQSPGRASRPRTPEWPPARGW